MSIASRNSQAFPPQCAGYLRTAGGMSIEAFKADLAGQGKLNGQNHRRIGLFSCSIYWRRHIARGSANTLLEPSFDGFSPLHDSFSGEKPDLAIAFQMIMDSIFSRQDADLRCWCGASL